MRWMAALLWLPVVLAAQTKPEDSCAISGQVSNALTGEPVRRALVSLRRIDMSPGVTTIQVSHTVATDAAGRFAMAGIAPGKYRLAAERNGFLATQHGSRGPGKSGTLLTLEPGQKSSDLAMRLTPHGVITGRVLDEEGEPVTGANVQVSRQIYAQGRKQMSRAGASSTNDLGEYRVFGLAPGRYFVSADARQNPMLPEAEDEYVTTWHPRTADAAAAAPIEVAAGAQLRSIDILLAKLHTVAVRGRVVSEAGAPGGGQGAQRTNFNVMLVARNAMGAPGNTSRGTAVTPEGTFDFRSVTPGSYFLIAQVNAQGKNFAARMTIQVGGASIEGITLPIRGGMPVSGRVRVEGETTQSIASVQVMLRPAETGGLVFGPLPSQQVKPDGSFQMDDVGADRYAISFSGVPEGFYVKGVRSGNLDVQADGLEVAGLSPAPLDVVLSPNAGQVTGTVLDPRTQKAALAMMVVLVPQEKERRDRETFYRTTTSDLSGKFTFKSVVPGEYRAYVWEEEVEYGAWMDPDFMKPLESRGEAVSVSESGRPAIQVHLIAADAQ